MDYTPRTDDEIARDLLLADGVYDAVVGEAEEQDDKKGNPMFKLRLVVYASDGGERTVFDYISPHWFHWKFKRFFQAAEAPALYEKGNVDASELQGKNVRVFLQTQKQEGYPPKNVVSDYVPKDGGPDDDLPF